MDMFTPDWLSNVGFPIGVASYLLVRTEKTIGELRDAVRDLSARMPPKPPTVTPC